MKLPACVCVSVRSGPPTIVVASEMVLFAGLTSPPPAIDAVLVRLIAVAATVTVIVIAGALWRGPSASLRVQLTSWPDTLHVHPSPAAAVGVRPAGIASASV